MVRPTTRRAAKIKAIREALTWVGYGETNDENHSTPFLNDKHHSLP